MNRRRNHRFGHGQTAHMTSLRELEAKGRAKIVGGWKRFSSPSTARAETVGSARSVAAAQIRWPSITARTKL